MILTERLYDQIEDYTSLEDLHKNNVTHRQRYIDRELLKLQRANRIKPKRIDKEGNEYWGNKNRDDKNKIIAFKRSPIWSSMSDEELQAELKDILEKSKKIKNTVGVIREVEDAIKMNNRRLKIIKIKQYG